MLDGFVRRIFLLIYIGLILYLAALQQKHMSSYPNICISPVQEDMHMSVGIDASEEEVASVSKSFPSQGYLQEVQMV